jgi:chemotaxis protein MotB
MTRRRRPEHVNHERWLVSYADFITLLFAFFVVLYSSSQVDKRRVGQLATAIQVAFQQMGVFDASNTKVPVLTSEPMPFSDVQMVENSSRFRALDRLVNVPRGALTSSPQRTDMSAVEKKLELALAPEIANRHVAIALTKDGIVVNLRELGFFHSGSTAFRPDALPTLSQFVKVIGPLQVPVRIEGHTDNVPIHTPRFDSNWELSTARATEIIKLFISEYDIAPDRLSASGYGEYYPTASNDTSEGRALNRRVDLVILNAASEAHTPLPSDVAAARRSIPSH